MKEKKITIKQDKEIEKEKPKDRIEKVEMERKALIYTLDIYKENVLNKVKESVKNIKYYIEKAEIIIDNFEKESKEIDDLPRYIISALSSANNNSLQNLETSLMYLNNYNKHKMMLKILESENRLENEKNLE